MKESLREKTNAHSKDKYTKDDLKEILSIFTMCEVYTCVAATIESSIEILKNGTLISIGGTMALASIISLRKLPKVAKTLKGKWKMVKRKRRMKKANIKDIINCEKRRL